MMDFWMGEVNLGPILLLFTFFGLFPVQLVLCFLVKSRTVRLIPVMILLVMTVIMILGAVICTGYIVFAFIVLAVYLGLMLAVCGAAWAVWGIVRLIKAVRG